MKKILFLVLSAYIAFADGLCDVECINDKKTKESMQNWFDGNFGLQPHEVNYILPYGYTQDPYTSSVPKVEYNNIEAQLQVSLKLPVAKNIFQLNEKYYLAYTQRAFWQLYTDSAPFRESLYSPEAFVEFPIEDEDSWMRLRSLRLGYKHESNGQPNTEGITFDNNQTLANFSRSINYLYAKLRTQYESFVSDFKLILPISDLSDNPDIMDYRGCLEMKFTYFVEEHMFTLMGRANPATLRGAAEATYSYPLLNDANFYIQVFSGYGESLIDYNRNLSKYSIGFSFSR